MENDINKRKGLSIKSVVIIVYTILVIIAFTVIIYTLFNNSMDAARKEADLACSSLNNDICNIVRNSIDITDHISKVYGDMISSGIIPLTGESDKDAMLINFLKNHSENISVFAYMDRDDNIYTAIKQDNQEIKSYMAILLLTCKMQIRQTG